MMIFLYCERIMPMHAIRQLAAIVLIAAVSGGSSMKRFAVNKLGNSLAAGLDCLR
jgi:hypothetical protein